MSIKLLGLFPFDNENFFHKLLPYFVSFLFSTILFGCINFVYENRHNLIIVLKASSLILSIITIFIKVNK